MNSPSIVQDIAEPSGSVQHEKLLTTSQVEKVAGMFEVCIADHAIQGWFGMDVDGCKWV